LKGVMPQARRHDQGHYGAHEPAVFRVIALPAPSDREKSQMYLQRYMPHFPAGGEIVIFDRSWYNRAGVERVMGFCHRRSVRALPENHASFEEQLVENASSSSNSGWKSATRSRSGDFWPGWTIRCVSGS
jgi:hypothetical protein